MTITPVKIHEMGYTHIKFSNPGWSGITKYTHPTRKKHVPMMVNTVGAMLRPMPRNAAAVISYEHPSA